jgi:uncharacterized membrane protein
VAPAQIHVAVPQYILFYSLWSQTDCRSRSGIRGDRRSTKDNCICVIVCYGSCSSVKMSAILCANRQNVSIFIFYSSTYQHIYFIIIRMAAILCVNRQNVIFIFYSSIYQHIYFIIIQMAAILCANRQNVSIFTL